jgi:hypothetical protein
MTSGGFGTLASAITPEAASTPLPTSDHFPLNVRNGRKTASARYAATNCDNFPAPRQTLVTSPGYTPFQRYTPTALNIPR